jgi:hypothetical protein
MATAHMSDVRSERLNNVDPLFCKMAIRIKAKVLFNCDITIRGPSSG